jgi:gliding motility-associated protein GldL
MGLVDMLQSKKGKVFMGYLYGWGAGVVIVGAMFKIQHWPGASAMLVGGLSIEAVIFFVSAFEPIHEEIDWSLVYPELAGMHGDEEHGHGHAPEKKEVKGSVTEELDKMLEEAKIGPELLQSLGDGMRNLSDSTGKLTNITDATLATNEYVGNIQKASNSVNELSSSYMKASESLGAITSSSDQGAIFAEELTKVSKNLSALNQVYELQLQGSNEHLKAANRMYEGIGQLMSNLNESVEDTKKYKSEVGQLASNLEQLNRVYGNMLNAIRS